MAETKNVSAQEYLANSIKIEAGQPAKGQIQDLYDEMDFQRAVQAYIWATPFVALSAMFESQDRDFGATLTRQGIFEQSVTPEYIVFYRKQHHDLFSWPA